MLGGPGRGSRSPAARGPDGKRRAVRPPFRWRGHPARQSRSGTVAVPPLRSRSFRRERWHSCARPRPTGVAVLRTEHRRTPGRGGGHYRRERQCEADQGRTPDCRPSVRVEPGTWSAQQRQGQQDGRAQRQHGGCPVALGLSVDLVLSCGVARSDENTRLGIPIASGFCGIRGGAGRCHQRERSPRSRWYTANGHGFHYRARSSLSGDRVRRVRTMSGHGWQPPVAGSTSTRTVRPDIHI